MRITLRTALLGFAALSPATFPVQPSEAAEAFRFRGDLAVAIFSSTSGCVDTFAFIFALNDKQQRPPGSGGTSSSLFVELRQSDICTLDVMLSASGLVSLNDTDFTVAPRLESAILDAEVELFDSVSGTSLLVDMRVDWTAVGDPERWNSHWHIRSPDSFLNSHSQGLRRPAEALAVVSDGITNFTPEPADIGTIQLDRLGDVSFSR